MENTDDIRRHEGNPDAGEPVGPRTGINQAFNANSTPKGLAIIILVIGIIVTAVGSITFILPLAIVGIAILVAGIIMMLGHSRRMHA